jgi:hypothetical protein
MNHQNQSRTNGKWGHVRYKIPQTQPPTLERQIVQQSVGHVEGLLIGEMKLEIGNLKTEVKELKGMKEGISPIGGAAIFMAIFLVVLVGIVWKK